MSWNIKNLIKPKKHFLVSNYFALQIIRIQHLQETKFEFKITIFEDPWVRINLKGKGNDHHFWLMSAHFDQISISIIIEDCSTSYLDVLYNLRIE